MNSLSTPTKATSLSINCGAPLTVFSSKFSDGAKPVRLIGSLTAVMSTLTTPRVTEPEPSSAATVTVAALSPLAFGAPVYCTAEAAFR